MNNKILIFTKPGGTGWYMPRNEDSERIRGDIYDTADIFLDEPDAAVDTWVDYKHVPTEAPVEFGILDYLDSVLTGWRRR